MTFKDFRNEHAPGRTASALLAVGATLGIIALFTPPVWLVIVPLVLGLMLWAYEQFV